MPKGIDLFVINEGEAREFAGTPNLIQAGRLLLQKGPRYVVIKLGEFGAVLFGPPETNHGLFRCGAFPLREVVDPTGAGDTFLGVFLGSLALGRSETEALQTAAHASALQVTKPGAADAIPTSDELRAVLK